MQAAQTPINFLNVSYFFQLIYNLLFSAHTPSVGGLSTLAAQIWIWVTVAAFFLTLAFIWMIVYYSLRLYQVVEEEDKKFGTMTEEAAHTEVEHSRWSYIMQLVESTQESDWRNAIIEADIMLGEMLTKNGFEGDSIGEQLKTASPTHFATLNDAWAAHKVRNEIAHSGSAYQLTDHTAYQTIGRYENVFREFHEI
jgi:hypothetical protein